MTTTRRDSEQFARLQEEALKRKAEKSFFTFVLWMWPILEPSTPFIPNWHIELICEYLQAVSEGRYPRLVINLPPRYMKSLLVSVLWPCWEWLHDPSLRSIFVSYSERLATRHAIDRRRLLTSPLYERHWGDRVILAKDQRTKLDLHNTRRGVMVATSVGGSVTGKGGRRLVIDDAHNPEQAESDTQRQHAIDFFTGTLSTRLDDHSRGAIVLVGQRLHHEDLSAYCLNHGFHPVVLPVEAEEFTTVRFPLSGRVMERAAGDLLWPAREDRAQIARQRETLGAHLFEGQYQQRPSPRTGAMFERQWWRYYDVLPPGGQYAQSWDMAFKDGPKNDRVVGLVAVRQGAIIYLVDRIKGRMGFNESCAAVLKMLGRYPMASPIYVEDAANGSAVIDSLKSKIDGIMPVQPQGGKYSRAAACQPRVQAGQVYLPNPRYPNGALVPGREWVEDFVEQMAQFPYGAHDDDVDAFTQLLVKWRFEGSGVSTSEILRMNMEDDDTDDDEDNDGMKGIWKRQF